MSKKFYMYFASLITVFATVLALNAFSKPTSATSIDNTPDCDNVAIIHCGAMTESALQAAFNANVYGDLPTVYAAFGLNASSLSGFVDGIVWKDGRVTVGDETVATAAYTAGRNYGGTPIAGTKNAAIFSTNKFVTDGQTALIKMVNGQFAYAVVKSCGNPVKATPVPPKPQPTYTCTGLSANKLSRTEYSFTTSTAATGGPTVVGYHYDFGDGTTADSTTTNIQHVYKSEGNYTVKVSVEFNVNGTNQTVTGPNCMTNITVEKPPVTPVFTCDALTVRTINASTRAYAYDIEYTATGGATLTGAEVDFGDNTTQTVAATNTKDIRHTYTQAGTYTTVTTLHFTVPTSDTATQNKDAKCQATVTAEVTPPAECKPGIPTGDSRCTVTPTEVLPSTGPADFLGGSLGIGSITAAGYYWRASRRNLISQILNR